MLSNDLFFCFLCCDPSIYPRNDIPATGIHDIFRFQGFHFPVFEIPIFFLTSLQNYLIFFKKFQVHGFYEFHKKKKFKFLLWISNPIKRLSTRRNILSKCHIHISYLHRTINLKRLLKRVFIKICFSYYKKIFHDFLINKKETKNKFKWNKIINFISYENMNNPFRVQCSYTYLYIHKYWISKLR